MKYKYTHNNLLEDIEKLNTVNHNHSLVAIKDTFNEYGNRYLLYYDERWECKLFLNYKTVEDDNENNLIENIALDLKLNRNVIECSTVAHRVQEKYSASHKEMRTYNHRLCSVYIKDFPGLMKKDDFVIDKKHYYWMTISDMRKDPEIINKNLDVVEFVNCELENTKA